MLTVYFTEFPVPTRNPPLASASSPGFRYHNLPAILVHQFCDSQGMHLVSAFCFTKWRSKAWQSRAVAFREFLLHFNACGNRIKRQKAGHGRAPSSLCHAPARHGHRVELWESTYEHDTVGTRQCFSPGYLVWHPVQVLLGHIRCITCLASPCLNSLGCTLGLITSGRGWTECMVNTHYSVLMSHIRGQRVFGDCWNLKGYKSLLYK